MKYLYFCFVIILVNTSIFGQTPIIKWTYDPLDIAHGQAAAADLNGDGNLEIVFGCYRRDSSIHVLNGVDGKLIWKYNAHNPGVEGCNDVAPLIYDINGDGAPEVIVPGSCQDKTFCFDGATGKIIWEINTRGSDSPPTIADIDGDGRLEILHGEFNGYVICIDALTGKQKWEISVAKNSWVQTAPTIVDLDGDGDLDFVVATWHFDKRDSIYAFRAKDQKKLWAYPVHHHIYHGTTVTDLDHDGIPDLLIGSWNDTLYCLNGADGTAKWKFAGNTGAGIYAPATVADIDNDGICEILTASYNKVFALTPSGKIKWQYIIPGTDYTFRGFAVADLTGDQYLDIVFGTYRGKLIALNGKDGKNIWTMDLAAQYGNPLFEIDHAPLIADFDHDGTIDIFVVGGHGVIPFDDNFGRAYMISTGVKGNGPDWPMFQQDPLRQTSLCQFNPTSVHEVRPTLPFTVYPVPFSTQTNIYFEHQIENITLEVINVFGQIVKKVDNISQQNFVLETENLPKGLYLIKVEKGQNLLGIKKVVIMD